MKEEKKIIGTLVPVGALSSSRLAPQDQGTFAAGEVFLTWLQTTNQSAWQVLPLHETQLELGSRTKHIPSPYKSYGVGLDPNYLATAFAKKMPTASQKKAFLKQHVEWIDDYALFCALRDHFGTDDWREWQQDIGEYEMDAVTIWKEKLAKQIDSYVTLQWQLHEAYTSLRKKAKERGIYLIGDLPFYISLQSPLVWAHQNIFQITKDGKMQYVSGIPNINNTFFGRQIWGHPLYDWDNAEAEVIDFWKMRLTYQAELYDALRFDHVRGFFVYGMMDLANERNDREVAGPGAEVFAELAHFCQNRGLSVFAEDDDDPPTVKKALQKFQIAGVRIFRFALEERKDHVLAGYAHISEYPSLTVSYSTTHDTETLLGYLRLLSPQQKQRIAKAAKVEWYESDNQFAKAIRDALLASPAQTVIIPIQDWLLTTDRINIPGTEKEKDDPNWQFKVKIPIEKLPTDINT